MLHTWQNNDSTHQIKSASIEERLWNCLGRFLANRHPEQCIPINVNKMGVLCFFRQFFAFERTMQCTEWTPTKTLNICDGQRDMIFFVFFFPFNKLEQFFPVRTKTPTDINPIAYCGIAFTYSYRISKERERVIRSIIGWVYRLM